jgi:LPS export ABC transporter protein LptC
MVVGEPKQRLSALAVSQSQSGVSLWDLKADRAVLADVEAVADVSDPRMQFYRDGKLASRLTALHGVVHMTTNDVQLSSGVVVTSVEDQTTLRTEQLLFSSSKKKFYTDREVRVRRPGGSLVGQGLEASPDLSEITVFHQRSVIDKKETLE